MGKSKYGYLAQNTFLFTISSFGSKILSFLLVPLYTSVLSTTEYGVADLVSTTSSLLLYVVTANVSASVLRFVFERKEKRDEIFGFGLKVILFGNTIFAIVLFVLFRYRIIHWDNYLYSFLFVQVFVSSLSSITNQYLRAIDKVKEVAIAGVISTAITIASNIITLLVFKLGVVGYLLSGVLGPFASVVFCLSKCGGIMGSIKNATRDRKVQIAMFAYCVPLIINGVAWWINASLDKYFVTAFLGASQNGIYAVSQKIPTILTTFSTIFMQAWSLSAIREFDAEDRDGFFINIYNSINVGLVMICSFVILLNIPLAKLLYSKDFFIAWQCSSWLSISVIFSAMSGVLASIFTAIKKSSILSISTAVSALTNILFNAILLPLMGIQGAAIATVLSFFFTWLIRLIFAKRYMQLRVNIILDLIVYLMLIAQVMLERMSRHGYVGQGIVFILILILYRKHLKKMIKYSWNTVCKRIKI